MAFNVNFYTFAKRVNSTKRPTGSGAQYSCIIKDGCGAVNPTIQLQMAIDGNPTAYNYAYISDFHRYYWVSEWIFEDRLWTAHLKSDPMATYKSEIGSYNGYVARAASAYDGDIMDLLYPATAERTTIANGSSQDPGWSTSPSSGGTFVVGIIGKSADPNGCAVTYYAVTSVTMTNILNYLLNENHYSTITDIEIDLLKCIFNPTQYIVSCMWFPFTVTGSNTTVSAGWWDLTGVSALRVSDPTQGNNLTFTIPKHPQAARGNYLNMRPFSSYFINAGPWGVIPLNNANLIYENSLSCKISVDIFTGSGRFIIYAADGSGASFEEHFAQIGVPIMMGQNSLNQGALANAGAGLMGGAFAAATGNIVAGISSAIQTVGSVMDLMQPNSSVVGSNGSFAFSNVFKLVGEFMTVVNEDMASRGRPLCEPRTMSTLSGYILCSDADPQIPGTESEVAEIVSYMNSGFYYE